MAYGEDDGIALLQRDNDGARLHARALLGHDEFAAGELAARFGEQDGELKREGMLSIEILVQTVVIARDVLEEQRGRLRLAGVVATVEEFGEIGGELSLDTHLTIPLIRDRSKVWIDAGSEGSNRGR